MNTISKLTAVALCLLIALIPALHFQARAQGVVVPSTSNIQVQWSQQELSTGTNVSLNATYAPGTAGVVEFLVGYTLGGVPYYYPYLFQSGVSNVSTGVTLAPGSSVFIVVGVAYQWNGVVVQR